MVKQSPDVAYAAGDGTSRFWQVFGASELCITAWGMVINTVPSSPITLLECFIWPRQAPSTLP